MALTVVVSGRERLNGHYETWGTIAFDTSYPTGGESFTAANMGLRVIDRVQVEPSAGYTFAYDYTNALLLAYLALNAHLHTITIAGGEAGTVAIGIDSDAASAALSKTAATARAGITGIQNVAAAAGAQVGNTVDLSAVTGVRWRAMGLD